METKQQVEPHVEMPGDEPDATTVYHFQDYYKGSFSFPQACGCNGIKQLPCEFA